MKVSRFNPLEIKQIKSSNQRCRCLMPTKVSNPSNAKLINSIEPGFGTAVIVSDSGINTFALSAPVVFNTNRNKPLVQDRPVMSSSRKESSSRL